MFGFFKKTTAQSAAVKDIEITLLRAFSRLEKASKDKELLTRSMDMTASLASCRGALIDAYNVPMDEQSPAMNLIIGNKNADYDLIASTDAQIMSDLKSIRFNRKAKINYIMFLLAPSSLK